MSGTAANSTTFVVAGFTAEVTVRKTADHVSYAVVEWLPRVPDFQRDFTVEQRREYTEKLTVAVTGICR